MIIAGQLKGLFDYNTKEIQNGKTNSIADENDAMKKAFFAFLF